MQLCFPRRICSSWVFYEGSKWWKPFDAFLCTLSRKWTQPKLSVSLPCTNANFFWCCSEDKKEWQVYAASNTAESDNSEGTVKHHLAVTIRADKKPDFSVSKNLRNSIELKLAAGLWRKQKWKDLLLEALMPNEFTLVRPHAIIWPTWRWLREKRIQNYCFWKLPFSSQGRFFWSWLK